MQAVAAAQAGCTLISPFPGRVLEWTKADNPKGPQRFDPKDDPGVVACRQMYDEGGGGREGGLWCEAEDV